MDPIWRAGAGRTVCPSETPVCELLGDPLKPMLYPAGRYAYRMHSRPRIPTDPPSTGRPS